MGVTGAMSVEAVATVARRYRPVALTVVAIVVIAFAVPGRPSSRQEPASATELAAPPTTALSTTPVPPATSVPPVPPPPTITRPTIDVPTSPTPRPSPSPRPSGSAPPAVAEPPSGGAPAPLTVREAGWASQGAGTPLATVGVPDGTLPVGTRLGQVDKASFVRLDGDATTLVLAEEPSGARASVGDPAVQACVIVADDAAWTAAEGMSFDDAPAWDPNACADGVRGDDGTWTFDLGTLALHAGDAGFALVPTADAPVDFQVAFAP